MLSFNAPKEAPMSLKRQGKRVQRALRAIPVEAIAPAVAAQEANGAGLWCLVADDLVFIPADGGQCVSVWDDPMEHAQFARWVMARPERVHETRESAVAFVRSRLGRG
jgi:hypothetical protein